MSEYTFVLSDDPEYPEKPFEVCDNCQYPAPLSRFPKPPLPRFADKTPSSYCEVCSCTFLSHATEYPGQCDATLFQSIGWVANRILDQLGAFDALKPTCNFLRAWSGTCCAPIPCAEHKDKRCWKCGEPATTECGNASTLCVEPECGKHPHDQTHYARHEGESDG